MMHLLNSRSKVLSNRTIRLRRRHRKQIGSPWRKLNAGQQALLVLAYLNVIGSGALILQLALVGPIQGSMLYKVYYYGGRIIFAMINVSLSYYLAKSSVRDACQVRRSRTSASDIPQNAR